MLAAGLILFLFIIYGLSSFVWTVEVEGAEEINPQKVLSELESLGVQAGVLKSDIDSLWIENQLIIRIPELSWASLEIRGSKAVLRVRESVLPPVLIDRDTPCNVVAAKDGIIDKMIVLDGQAMVSEGQTVKKGQLLISGIIEHPNTIGVRYVHSMGKIIARTWYEETVVLERTLPARTGRRSKSYIDGNALVPYEKVLLDFGS